LEWFQVEEMKNEKWKILNEERRPLRGIFPIIHYSFFILTFFGPAAAEEGENLANPENQGAPPNPLSAGKSSIGVRIR
jgi:hypothetical protein